MLPEFDLSRAGLPLLHTALRDAGALYLRHPLFPPARCEQALEDARSFFALPAAQKRRIAIEHSRHFRGYSEMRNERDWREQVHFGPEEPPGVGPEPYSQLQGPNLWPPSAAWRQRLLQLIADLEQVGRELLATLSREVGLSAPFLRPAEKPYSLLKLIHYLVPEDGRPRSGVAPHVDFSWITLLLQDSTGGLEIATPDGRWIVVPPVPGTLVVNIGEILDFATGGYSAATPHRVINRSPDRTRLSIPFFVNPALTTTVEQVPPVVAPSRELWRSGEHVHRVLDGTERDPIHFGNAEWQRKGLGVWCKSCVPPPPHAETPRA